MALFGILRATYKREAVPRLVAPAPTSLLRSTRLTPGGMAARTVALVTDRMADGAEATDVEVLARVHATLPVLVSLAIDCIPHT